MTDVRIRSSRRAAAAGYWTSAVIGLPTMAIAWIWLALSSLEEVQEVAKAGPGSNAADGIAFWYGGLPLVAAHVIGTILLGLLGMRWRFRPTSAWLLALTIVVIESALGLLTALLLNGGHIFAGDDGIYVP
jgi:hypothetical protein